MTFPISAHKSALKKKNKTILQDKDLRVSQNCHVKTHGILPFCVHKKAGYLYAVSAAPRNFISVAALGGRAEPPFFWKAAAISSKDLPLVSGTLKYVNRVKAKSTPAKRKNT